jgi:hypothetical protein
MEMSSEAATVRVLEFYSGLGGAGKLYAHICSNRHDILLFPSPCFAFACTRAFDVILFHFLSPNLFRTAQ